MKQTVTATAENQTKPNYKPTGKRPPTLADKFRTGQISPEEAITELARTFPTIKRAMIIDPRKWDIDAFMHSLNCVGHGPREAMLFVANVWNPEDAPRKKWHFNAVEALGVWDGEHRAAFLTWCQDPWWP